MLKSKFVPIQVHENTKTRWQKLKPPGMTADLFTSLLLDTWQSQTSHAKSLSDFVRQKK